ncbi:DJ-1/PfpI family protein [Streptomyces sp. G45]|uniref:DJ-1/PfpI family protein n=1 Tax=Streptomyces sp. G45 TaxID=3406627 RepID=UPI003C2042C1
MWLFPGAGWFSAGQGRSCVLTGAAHWTLADGTRHPTGFWAEEAVVPYQAFTAAGHEVVVAPPGGVVPTADQASLTPEANGGQAGADRTAAALAAFTALAPPLSLADVDLDDCAAVFCPGGHGPMEDLAVHPASGALLPRALDSGTPLAVVCGAWATGHPGCSCPSRRPQGAGRNARAATRVARSSRHLAVTPPPGAAPGRQPWGLPGATGAGPSYPPPGPLHGPAEGTHPCPGPPPAPPSRPRPCAPSPRTAPAAPTS